MFLKLLSTQLPDVLFPTALEGSRCVLCKRCVRESDSFKNRPENSFKAEITH